MTRANDGLDRIELTVPAHSSYVSVLRTVTASLAATRDFTIEEIDDLRIAVDEASSLLLPHVEGNEALRAVFIAEPDALSAQVSIPVRGSQTPELDPTSFAWMVLSALTDSVESEHLPDRLSVTLRKARGLRR